MVCGPPAEGADHAHYWVYRERIVGSGEDAEPRWYLHGLFGQESELYERFLAHGQSGAPS